MRARSHDIGCTDQVDRIESRQCLQPASQCLNWLRVIVKPHDVAQLALVLKEAAHGIAQVAIGQRRAKVLLELRPERKRLWCIGMDPGGVSEERGHTRPQLSGRR